MPTITLLLAEDHNVVREGLRALLRLEPDFTIIGEAATGREAVRLTLKLSPNVIIMDLAMPLLNGMEATRQIIHAAPAAKIVILSAYDDNEHVEPAIAAGASAYLLKTAAAGDLAEAIQEVNNGNSYFSPAVSERHREKRPPADHYGDVNASRPTLSFREAEVLQLIVEGFNDKEIAFELRISFKTVRNYRQSIMAKLNIHSVVGLVHYAVRKGTIEMRSAKTIFTASISGNS
jgi:DNA-binding NarL/FixJ family response regulator